MINQNFVILGATLSFIGSMSYLVDTLKGRVKPDRMTWFLWALAPLIAFSAEIKQGVGLQALMTFTVGFNPLLIFAASFFSKQVSWKLTRLDYICGAFSVVGLILWWLTKIGDVAIACSILADGFAALPTIIKAFTRPQSESYRVFLLSSMNALITLLVIKQWDFAHYAFPIYMFILGLTLTFLIKFSSRINSVA